jgi:hypothetical protein
MLEKLAGKPLPTPNLRTERKTGAALPSPFKFERHGKSGLEVSELFAQTARHIDDICVIRSMHADVPNHEPSLMLLNCGDARQIRPSMGSWVTYGLGSENQNLPGFIAMCPGGYPIQETQNWQSAFLPGAYQGTYVDTRHTTIEKLIENVRNHAVGQKDQRAQLDLLRRLNEKHIQQRQQDAQLEARIQSFELAYRMQSAAPEALDLRQESAAIQNMYGMNRPESVTFGRQCLLARRLVERNVRFVQIFFTTPRISGGAVNDVPWDGHNDINVNHRDCAVSVDQPVGALLTDLKSRGLLDSTLVVWGGEFGRTSDSQGAVGRDHNPHAHTIWMAGGGIRGGVHYGATDDFGYKAVHNRTSVHDIQATVLHLLGLDHTRLTYRFNGRDFRLTDVAGNVIRDVLA